MATTVRLTPRAESKEQAKERWADIHDWLLRHIESPVKAAPDVIIVDDPTDLPIKQPEYSYGTPVIVPFYSEDKAGNFDIDSMLLCLPVYLTFENPDEALIFKLTWA